MAEAEAIPASEASIDPTTEPETQVEDSPEGENSTQESKTKETNALPPTEETQKPTPKKYKVKVDDQESEIDEDELIRGYQKGKAGDKRLREAAQQQKQIKQFLDNLKKGDHNFLAKVLGKDQAKKMAEKLLLEEIEYEELPEHEKTIRQLQREKEDLQKEKETQEKQRVLRERQALEKKASQELEEDVLTAIKESETKPSNLVLRSMVDHMKASLVHTKQKLPAKEALQYVHSILPKQTAEYIGSLPSDKILEFKKLLPKNVIEAFRKDDQEQVLSQTSVTSQKTDTQRSTPRRSRVEDRRMTTDSWFEKMEKRLGG